MTGKISHKQWWLHTQPSSQVSVQLLPVLMDVKYTQSWCEYLKNLKKVRKGPVVGLYCQKICETAQVNQSSKPNSCQLSAHSLSNRVLKQMFLLLSKQLNSFETFSASLYSLGSPAAYPRPIIYFKSLIRLAYSMC